MKSDKKKGITLIDIDSPRTRNLALVFLIFVSLLFDVLFCLYGKGLPEPEISAQAFPGSAAGFEKAGYRRMVSGHPIERMIPYISRQDGQVASFMLAIAKKESDWGTYAPRKDGKDCYNYWGYRGTYNQTDSGYSCFDSPRQAVAVIGTRIEELLAQEIDTPEKMVVWKCGWSCRGHSRYDVRKWISDVGTYVDKVNDIST